jgi:hypothetical protein
MYHATFSWSPLWPRGEYIYFLDSDVYTEPDTLQGLRSHELPIVTALYYRRHELPVSNQMLAYLPDRARPSVQAKRQVGMPIFTPAIWKDFTYVDEKRNKLRSFRPILDGEFSRGELMEADAVLMGCCLPPNELIYGLGDLIFENGVRATEDGDGIAYYNPRGTKIARLDAEGNWHIKGKVISDL